MPITSSPMLTLLIDPMALAMVWVGAPMIAWFRMGTAAMRDALNLRGNLGYAARLRAEQAAANHLLNATDIVMRQRGVALIDRLSPRHLFLRQALDILANSTDIASENQRMQDYFANKGRRSADAAAWWDAVADAAPACGMMSTVIGLALLFASHGADAANLGFALAGTLHGLLLSTVVAGPMAGRIAQQHENRLRWQEQFWAALVHRVKASNAAPAPLHKRAA